nr:MAG TPA: hypothetical protein [Caudoviricetes sp.]
MTRVRSIRSLRNTQTYFHSDRIIKKIIFCKAKV